MIEFNGRISGAAEDFFWKRSKSFVLILLSISMAVILPVMIFLSVMFKTALVVLGYLGCFVFFFVLLLLLKPGKKESAELVPERVFTDDEYIVSVCKNNEQFILISDVRKVTDYGEFYVVFPSGKVSYNFICQKNLLTQGTLEEFEALFPEEIIEKNRF